MGQTYKYIFMKIYDDKHIKNIVFVGAHNSGKTTLAETMLYEAGIIKRRGTIENKNTVSDYHEVEHQRVLLLIKVLFHMKIF